MFSKVATCADWSTYEYILEWLTGDEYGDIVVNYGILDYSEYGACELGVLLQGLWTVGCVWCIE